MKPETPDSAPGLDAMCVTDRQRLSPGTSEPDFLADRAADARTAIGRKLCDMKATLTKLTGVRSCAARHPWILTGSAVAAGVVVGAVLSPAARKRIKRPRKTPSDAVAESPPARREPETPRKTGSFMFSIAGTVLAAVLQPLIQGWLAPPAAARGVKQNDPPSTSDPAGAAAPEGKVD
jgi:hypothetical protein